MKKWQDAIKKDGLAGLEDAPSGEDEDLDEQELLKLYDGLISCPELPPSSS